jgi:hypothetical protein
VRAEGRFFKEGRLSFLGEQFTAQLLRWSKARRVVVLQERAREGKDAVGRLLLDVPG